MSEGSDLDRRLAVWRRYEPPAMKALPFLMLVFSTIVAFAVPVYDGQELVATGVVAVHALGWLTWFLLVRPVTDRTALLYAFGLAVLAAALVVLSPWYGFFSFIGYLNALTLLIGAARYALVLVTAATAAASQIGGVWNIQGAGIVVYLVVFGINAGLFLVFGQYGDLIEQQNDQRKETIDELALANEALERAMAENAALHDQLVVQARDAGVSEERQRLAREIHDTIAQGLAGIVAQLEAATQGPPAEQERHLGLARSLARESLGEARRSVEALQPGALEGARLPDALAAYAKRWSELHGVTARVETIGQPVPLATETEVTLYRVAQEALTNVGRHAGAANALVTVSYGDDGVALDVGDDGHGFAAEEALAFRDVDRPGSGSATGGFGLTTMRQRTAAVGGVIQVDSSGEGTVVHVEVPRVAWAGAGGA